MCPRHMCQSLVASSFSVAMKASSITILLITFYKFVIHSALRTVMESLVTIRALSVLTCIHELPRLPMREGFFSGLERVSRPWVSSHVLKHLHVDTVYSNYLRCIIVPHQDCASFKKLICAKPLLFWAHVICAPWVKQPSIWEPPFPPPGSIYRTKVHLEGGE